MKIETKVCKDCSLELPTEMFRVSGNSFRNDCRKCENKKRVLRRELKKNSDSVYRDKLREYDRHRKRKKSMM